MNILECEPNEISRGDAAKLLKNELNNIQKKIDSLSFGITNGVDRIKEHCIELRAEVQLATESVIQQMNEFNEKFIDKIDKYEKECIRVFEVKKEQKEEFNKLVDEMKMFHNEWTDYLGQYKMNDKVLNEANAASIIINEKGDKEKANLDHLIFNGNMMRFIKNNNILNESFLGTLLKQFNMDSSILSNENVENLMTLCDFTIKQNWKLLYRATRDGFGAAQFHAKCDNNLKTLVVIKSTNGYIFGGYTQLDWSGKTFKNDPNAFLFSLVNASNSPRKINRTNYPNSIFCKPTFGPTFGSGHDLYICNNSNTSNGSYSNPNCYSVPSEVFFAGSYNFLTTEIEVFLQY